MKDSHRSPGDSERSKGRRWRLPDPPDVVEGGIHSVWDDESVEARSFPSKMLDERPDELASSSEFDILQRTPRREEINSSFHLSPRRKYT